MSLESIKNLIHQGVNEIVTTATIDEMIGDTAEYQKKLCKVSLLAEILDIETEITSGYELATHPDKPGIQIAIHRHTGDIPTGTLNRMLKDAGFK